MKVKIVPGSERPFRRDKASTGAIVVESTIHLDVPGERGWRVCPQGVIQSELGPSDSMSSDLALDTPFGSSRAVK